MASINTLFYSKKTKTATNGLVPIYMRVTINGKRFEISTNQFVRIEQWSSTSSKVKGNSGEARQINTLLETLRFKVNEYYRELLFNTSEVTIELFRSKWLGTGSQRARMIIEIFEHHNQQIEKLIGKDYAPLTLKRYKTSLNHTCEFLSWKFNATDYNINNINYEFISDFEFWLKSVKNCDHNTAMKHLSNFKKIINICLRNGWLQRSPFIGYKLTRRLVERETLTQNEIDKIFSKNISIERLNTVRDVFIFCCYTGLAYVDIHKLKPSDISIGMDGSKWIFIQRHKTGTPSRIPLLPKAEEILNKYTKHPQCKIIGRSFPVLSNQKMNAYLKEIGKLCDIPKVLTMHIARHTFATTITLNNGVPIETVGSMLGHTDLKTTQHYARIRDKKISEDMNSLRARLSESPGSLVAKSQNQ